MRRGGLRSRCALALVALVTIVASACSSAASGSSGSSKNNVDLNTASVAQLAKIAAQEGKLVSYDSAAADVAPKLVAAFEKSYPGVKVTDDRLSAADIPTRAFAEERAGRYLGDVAGASGSYMTELRLGGATEPYTPPTKIPMPAGLKLPAGYATVDSVDTDVIAYNPAQLKAHNMPVPTTWSDFAKPAWKGHFSVDTEAVDWYAGLIAEYGHSKALKLIQAIGNNDPVPVTSHSQAVVQLEAGSPWATVTTFGYIAERDHLKDPQHVAFVNFNPLIATPDMTYVMKNAPDPAAARLYINWDLSKAGQQAMVDLVGLQSLRTDVKQDTNVWDPSKWTPIFGNVNYTTQQLSTLLSEFQSAFHVSS